MQAEFADNSESNAAVRPLYDNYTDIDSITISPRRLLQCRLTVQFSASTADYNGLAAMYLSCGGEQRDVGFDWIVFADTCWNAHHYCVLWCDLRDELVNWSTYRSGRFTTYSNNNF